LSRFLLVFPLAIVLVFALAGCGGGDGGDGGPDNGESLTAEEYSGQVNTIAAQAAELGRLVVALDFEEGDATSYVEDLKGLQQSSEELIPPEALRDAHEVFLEGLGLVAEGAELADEAIQSGDEDGFEAVQPAVSDGLDLLVDALLSIRQVMYATPTP
jgi:hypothetical protein